MNAKGTFEVTDWQPVPPYDERDGVALQQINLAKTFQGDLTATSTVTMLVTASEHEDSRSYVALERIVGSLGGREGGFVVQHNGVSDRGDDSLTVWVVPGSGTGRLRGLRGEMRITVAPDGSHSYAFDYEL